MAEEFRERDLTGAVFVNCDLAGARVRGSNVEGLDIDDPFLLRSRKTGVPTLLVNGVDVAPFVEAELNRRFPGRELREATDLDGLRAAWEAVRESWARAVKEADTLPAGAVDARVAGEWSFAQTMRHLVMAIDVWLRQSVLGESDFHPIGVPHDEFSTDGYDTSVFFEPNPPWERTRAVFEEYQARVTDFLASATPATLEEPRKHPWGDVQIPVRSCLRTILSEEWEHLRYALRDLPRS